MPIATREFHHFNVAGLSGTPPVGSPSGGPWVMAFEDNFDTAHATAYGTGPDPAVWADHYIAGDGERTNNAGAEHEWYAHGYYGHSVAGGELILTSAFQGASGVLAIDPACANPMINGETPLFTSGMISSYPGLNFTYGYVEGRIRFDTAPSATWTAFWMQSSDAVNPPPEFDIQEFGGQGQGERSTFHITGGGLGGPYTPGGSPDYTQYHAYGMRWTPSDVTFFLDGTQTGTYTTAASIPSLPMHIMCCLQTEATSGTGYPATMTIDYIRVWSASGLDIPVISSVTPSDGVPVANQLAVAFGAVSGAASYRATACPADYYADTGVIGAPARYSAAGASSPLTITGLENGIRYAVMTAAVTAGGLYSPESARVPSP
jgi:beta-glucanase (GH16 family)